MVGLKGSKNCILAVWGKIVLLGVTAILPSLFISNLILKPWLGEKIPQGKKKLFIPASPTLKYKAGIPTAITSIILSFDCGSKLT